MVGIEFGSGLRLAWSYMEFDPRILPWEFSHWWWYYLWFNTRCFLRQKYQKNITNWVILRIETMDLGIKTFGTSQKFRRIGISRVIRNTSSRKLEDVHPNLGAKNGSAMNTGESFFGVVWSINVRPPKGSCFNSMGEYLMLLPICIIKKLQPCLFL